MIRLNSSLRKTLFAVSFPIITTGAVYAKTLKTDVFEHTSNTLSEQVVDIRKGTSNPEYLLDAPNPELLIAGEKRIAKIVIDLNQNRLYKYDDKGHATEVYAVASGKKSCPTTPMIKSVAWIEKYPYQNAYGSKRKKNPAAYGPNLIVLFKVDPKTGETYCTNGQFLHGNNNFNSLGTYASLGCVRVDNDAIKKFAKELKKGDIVWFKKD